MPEHGFPPAQNTEGADAGTELWDWLSCSQRCGPDPVPVPSLHLISPLSLLWSCIIQHPDKEKTGQQKYLMNGGVEGTG